MLYGLVHLEQKEKATGAQHFHHWLASCEHGLFVLHAQDAFNYHAFN